MPSNKLLKAFDTKQTKFRSSWLKNATKSVGITMGAALEEVAPNTVEIAKSGTEVARSVLSTLKVGKSGIERINDSNYTKIGKTAIRNAMDSIKTGKFGDGGDMFGMMDMGGESDEGFSYGDDDIDSSSSLSLDGLSSISDQINRQSIAQIKTAQANMDTMISINSARMFQTQQISGEILNHITNMENSLASMVQFNNETMLKFVQASLGYYERTGAALTETSTEEEPEEKVRASSVFNNRRGGVNLGRYKEHIKRNLQTKLDEHGIGMILDENTLQMLAADPIGIGAGIAARAAIDKFDKVSGGLVTGIEERISSAIPNALMSLTKLSDSDNPIARFIGDVFGLKAEKNKGSFKDIKINKGPIPFDGETKHAITTIITHELRNQTGYLKVIADKVINSDSDQAMRSNREYFNEETGRFERGFDVDKFIANHVADAVNNAFANTKFGEEMSNFTSQIEDEEDRKVVEKSIQDMYMKILKQEKDSLSLKDLMEITRELPIPGEARNVIQDRIKKLAQTNKTAFNTVGQGRLLAREASNDKFDEIRQNRGFNYLEDSSFIGLEGDELFAAIDKKFREGDRNLKSNLKTDVIYNIISNEDFFNKAATDPRYAEYMKYITSFDKATSADYEELAKKGVEKGDKKLKELREKILGNPDVQDMRSELSNIGSGSRATISSAVSGAKSYVGKQAEEIGSSLSNVGSHLIGGLQTKTGMFSRFLFGDQSKRTDGFFDGIAKSFNEGLKRDNPDLEMTDGKKAVAMGGVGALTGAALAHFGFLPAILAGTGPIGGAVAGLTLAIAGAGPMFKKALFGGDIEEFEDENGKKYTHKTKGVIGRITSTLEVNLINPVKTAALNAVTKTALNIEHGILIPFKYLAKFGAETLGDAVRKTFGRVGDLLKALSDENSLINKLTGGLFKAGTSAVGGLASAGINLATSIGGAAMNLPGNIFGAFLHGVNPKLAQQFDKERAGYREKKQAANLVNANRKKHDKNAKLINKITNGEYNEDTDEARAYIKWKYPDEYDKYFGKDEHGNYKRKGQIDTIDTERNMKKQLVGVSGASISGDVAGFDSSSQTAIYTARMVIMQEQLIRAILGEKVKTGVNEKGELVGASHDSQKTDADILREKNAKTIAGYWDKLRDPNTSEEEREQIKARLRKYDKNFSEDKLNDADFTYDSQHKQNALDMEFESSQDRDYHGFFGRLLGRIKYDIGNAQLNREYKKHLATQLGLPYHTAQAGHLGQTVDEGGEGFGGRGDDEKLQEELNRKEAEADRYRAELAKQKADEGRKAAIERGKTIDEIKEEKEKKEELDWKDKILKAVQGVKVETEEQHKSWTDIFSKKGLLTAGLLLAAPFLIKALPGIITFVKDTGPKIVEGVTTVVNNIGPVLVDALSGIAQGVNSILKFLGHDTENSKDTDKSGIDNTTSAKTGVALNLARIAKHSSEYATRDIVKGKGLLKNTKIAKAVRTNTNLNTVIGKGVEKGKYAINSLTSAGTLKNAAKLESAAQDLGKAGYELMDVDPKKGQQMMKKAEKMLDKSVKLSNKGSAGGKILDKVIGWIDDFFKKLLELFKKKFGNTTATSFKELGRDQLIAFCKKHPNKITTKVAERLSAGSGAAAISAGLSEAIFATLGGINGISGAAKLFHVPSKSVDTTMRVISGLFGAAAGTTVGGIIDLVLQIFYGATGIDILYMAATVLYTTAMKLAGREDKIEALNANKEALNNEYDEYKNTEIKKSYDAQLKAGLIPENTTFEEFLAGVEDGTYQAIYDSKSDYIAKNHGALSDKIMQGLGKGWKSYKKGLSLALGSIETTYTDSNGNTYKKNQDGNYDIITADGENVGSVTKDMIPEDAKKSTKYSTGLQNSLALGKQFLDNLATNEKTKNTVLGKGATIVKDTAKKVETFWNNVKEGGINFIRKKVDDKVVYRPVDNPLSYYKYNKNKNTFSWYNQDGEIIEEDAKTYDEMMTLYSNGLVSRDSSLSGVTTAAKTSVKDKINTLGSSIKSLWEKGKTGISNAIDKAKTGINNLLASLTGNDTTDTTETTETATGGNGRGGRGALYSQNDSRWKNSRYGSDGATMGDSGCGPTAVAMALSDVTGRNVNPMQMADLAQATGDRDSTGTNWNFVGNAASMTGIPSTQVYNPSAGYIGGQLASGKEMILSGRTGGYGGGFGSAYTPAGHYIVGTGIDRNGIVTYKDPTTGGYGRIPLSMLSSETGSAWTFGGRGPETSQGTNYSLNYRPNYAYNDKDKYNASFNSGWVGKRTIDSSSTISLNYRPDYAYDETSETEENAVNWLGAVITAKKVIAASGKGYELGDSMSFTVENKKFNVRNDCSGFVTFALQLAGLIPDTKTYASSDFIAGDWLEDLRIPKFFSELFKSGKVHSITDLRLGDIICYSGHVEVFADNDNGKMRVYNVGSDSSANNPGITPSGYKFNDIKAVYRPKNVGDGTSGDASISNSGKKSAISEWWDKIVNAVSSFFSHTLGQAFSGGNYEAWTPDMVNEDDTTDESTNETIDEDLAGGSGRGFSISNRRSVGGFGRIPSFGGRGNINGIATADWEAIPGGKADKKQVNGISVADWEAIPTNSNTNSNLGTTIDTSNSLNSRPSYAYSDKDQYKSSFNSGWVGKRTIDSSSTTSLHYRPDEAYAPEDQYKDNAEYQRWLDTIAYVKSYASKKQPRYDQSAYVTVTTSDGVDIKMRTDCSGFVTTCLIAYGAISNGTSLTSNSYASKENSTLKNSGFIPMDWPGWDSLIPGDIIALNGHVEIFAKNEGNTHKVWNWGSNDSASNPGITSTGHKNGYKTVWRHPSAGAGGTISESGSTDATVSKTTAGTSGKSSGITDWWDKVTGAVSSFFSHTLGQMFSGGHEAWTPDLFDSEWSGTTGENSESTGASTDASISGESGTSSGFSTVSSAASPSTRSIFQKLLSKGLNNVAASGIIGNWQVESSNNPNRFEADYTGFAKEMGGREEIFKDNDTLNTFTNRLFENYSKNGKSINQSAYKGSDGNLYPGMGLAQWTGPRGQQLLEFANNKGQAWNTADTQIDFFMNGPNEFNSKSGLMEKMNSSQTPTDAANTFFDYFEMNNPGYNQRAPGWVNIDKRRGYAEDFYSKFKDVGVFDTIDTTDSKSLNYIPTDVRNKIANEASQSSYDANVVGYDSRGFKLNESSLPSAESLYTNNPVDPSSIDVQGLYNQGGGGFGIGHHSGTGYYGPKYNPKSGGGYGFGTSSNTETLIKEIINLMYNLIDVESGASGKLDNLDNLKGTTNNTLIAGGDGGTLSVQSMGKHIGNEANSRNFNQAYKIATTI